jgi:hypothetical protein
VARAVDEYPRSFAEMVQYCFALHCGQVNVPEDRLVAISAVAKETKKILDSGLEDSCEYLAGLWSCFLEEQFL